MSIPWCTEQDEERNTLNDLSIELKSKQNPNGDNSMH